MASGKRKRVPFDLKARLRDHGNCLYYERCLDVAADLNAPRVCWEACWNFVEPHPYKPARIAEDLDDWRETYGGPPEVDDEVLAREELELEIPSDADDPDWLSREDSVEDLIYVVEDVSDPDIVQMIVFAEVQTRTKEEIK